jgi:bacteriorhodopsin
MYQVFYGDFQAPVFDRGLTDEFYTYAAAAFGIAVIYSYIAYVNAKTDEKKSLALVLCAVNVVAAAAYVIQIFRLTPTFIDHVGHPVDPSRFLEWVATCPILYVLLFLPFLVVQETAMITSLQIGSISSPKSPATSNWLARPLLLITHLLPSVSLPL